MVRSGSTAAKVAPKTRSLIALILGPALALGSVLLSPIAATPARAAANDIVCGGGYVYGVASGSTALTKVSVTGASATIGNFNNTTSTNINALGITPDAGYAYAMGTASGGTATMYTYRNSNQATASYEISGFPNGQGTFLAGAVDPTTGYYWVGGISNNTFYAYSIDPATHTTAVQRFTSAAGNYNADMAFDGRGNLYVAFSPSSSTTNGMLRRYAKSTLTGTPAGTQLAEIPASSNGYPGMAFASDGYLYMTTSGTLRKVNPTDGSQVGGSIAVNPSSTFSDLGSCATPVVMDAVQKNVVSRNASTDQFSVSLSGNAASLTAITSGNGTGIQATAGPVLVLPALNYSVAETAVGTTSLSDYLATYECVDAVTGSVFVTGSGNSFTLKTPAIGNDGKGANITCVFTNEAKKAAIEITKNASGTPTKAGDKITYSFTVKNTGNRPLSAVTVTDPMVTSAPTSGTITCDDSSLAVGASTNCTASPAYTVTQADVQSGKVVNTATVTASPPTGEGAAGSVTDTDTKTVTIAQTPMLKIVKRLVSGDPFTAGDQLTYGFTVTNTGNVVVTDVGVDDPKVTGEDCSPKTLNPGQSADCTANDYTVTAADVTAGEVVNTATPTGSSAAGNPATDPASTPKLTTRIGTPPVANPNTKTTRQNTPVALNPLTEQTADTEGVSGTGTHGRLDPASVKLTGTGAAADGKSLTNADGEYVVDPITGVVTFTPARSFTGKASPIGYQVTDTTFGLTATSTITITVDPVTPVATNDTDSTPYLTPKTVSVLGNDAPGNASVPLVASSVQLRQPDGTYAATLTVTGQGTYTANTDGTITFTPVSGYSGTADAVTYRVADTNGTTTTATLTMTVAKPPAPSAADDAASGLQGHAVAVTAKTGDSAGGSATLQDDSVKLKQTDGSFGKSAVVASGKGTWTVADDGIVTFTPEPAFTGTVSIDYSIADELHQTATATITVTITPSAPDAVDDVNHDFYGRTVTTAVLGNDKVGPNGAAIDPASLAIYNPVTHVYSGSLATADGSYSVNPDHTIAFVPNAGFHGEVTEPITYRVSDVNGATDTATLTITIGNPPQATSHSATTPQGVPVSLGVVAGDDTPGDDGAGVSGSIDPTSAVFTSADPGSNGRTLTVAGTGTFTIDAATGEVTFTPLPAYTGTTPKVSYRVTDSFGNTASATLQVTVSPVTVTARNDAAHTPFNTPVTTAAPLVGNDSSSDSQVPLVPGSVVFVAGAGDTLSDGGTKLANADGTYQLNTDGTVTFTPIGGKSGAMGPVTYQVANTNGTTDTATLTVTIGRPPVATLDTDSTPQNVTVVVDVLANDAAGYDGSLAGGLGLQGSLVPSSVTFTASSATNGGRTLTTSEGVWTIDSATGEVTFDPNASYTGTTNPVEYAVTDSHGNTATATVAITVAPITPKANDNANHTPYRTPVTTDVVGGDPAVGGDEPGDPSVPLVRSTVVITTPGATEGGKKLVVDGVGTWTVTTSGDIAFVPSADFHGGPATISYQVSDSNGTPATAQLTVTVGVPPHADDESGTTPQNTDIVLDLLTGDLPGQDGAGHSGSWDRDSLVFASNGSTTLTVDGEGTYTIDQATGEVTFDPVRTFTGKAATVTYQVTDSFGNTATAKIDITVTALTPVATNDSRTTPYRTPVTVAVLDNDQRATGGPALDPATVVITTTGADPDGKGLDTAQGTWKVDGTTGAITFTPNEGFFEDAVITYQVRDGNGTPTTATVTVTVPRPAAPTLVNDTASTPYLQPVTTTVLANDNSGALTTLQKGSVRLYDAASDAWVTTLTIAGEGTYSVDTTGAGAGKVTFAPASGFSGTVVTPVTYRVADELGQTGTATLTPSVGTPATATDNHADTDQGVAVNLHQLGDDTAGTSGTGTPGTLDPAKVVFTSASATDNGRTLVVAGEGTWTIDPATGEATFTPLKSFSGDATAVGYRITDSYGNTASATLTVHVTGLTPTAAPDSGHGEYGSPVTVDVLGNDHGAAASAPLIPGSVTIVGAPGDGKELVVPGQGTWTVNPTTGAITFTPEAGFHGTPDAISYQVADRNGTTTSASVTVTIGAPPTAADDTTATPYRTPVELTPLANDSAGDDGAGARAPLDPSLLVFTSDTATDGGRRLATPQGTWVIDGATGVVTFTPAATFSGTTPPVEYRVTDRHGHHATAALTVTVGEPPAAATDSAKTLQNVPVSLDPLANDVAGDDGLGAGGTLDPRSVVLTSAGATPDGKTLVLDGTGTFSVDPATGKVTFTPVPSFTGAVPVVTYRVTDSFGNLATAEIRVTVTPVVPEAANDATTGAYGQPVVIDILGNDLPGDNHTRLDPATLVFTDPGATEGGRVLVVAGEGTWRINPDGTVTFTPAEGFSGVTKPAEYRIADTNGVVATASITVTVAAGPAASDDQVKGTDRTVRVPVLSNDHAGDGCTLDAGSVVLVASDGTPVDPTTSLVVDGEGTWTVNPDGSLTFRAADGFDGWTVRVTYRVSDSCGHTTQALARAWVPPTPEPLAYTGAAVSGAIGLAILLLGGGGLLLALRGRPRGRRFA
ncbi:MAG: tandem-95 repeat protein [Propionibacteriaceae bacterium]|nr:tandem-95 repeat protein [Propionibacteriaceae bacterium]